MKRPNLKSHGVPAFAFVLIILIVGLGLLWRQERHLNNQLTGVNQLIKAQQAEITTLNSAASLSHVVVSVTENAVYMPDFRLKLPLNSATLQLLYGSRMVGNTAKNMDTVIDVSTTAAASYPQVPLQRLACTPVRLAFEAKSNPYNPHEKNVGSVSLADGRTLQIYAFHEPSCDPGFSTTNTDTDAIGALFKQAQSY